LGVGLTTLPCKKRKLLRSLQGIQPFLMEEDCGGGQGLSWAVEPRRERERERERDFEDQIHFLQNALPFYTSLLLLRFRIGLHFFLFSLLRNLSFSHHLFFFISEPSSFFSGQTLYSLPNWPYADR
jgi:hypothetical protein